MSNIPEEAGRVAANAIDAFRAQPGLLFLTIVNIAFLIFVYFVGTLVLSAYRDEQHAIHERYTLALKTVDRCVDAGLGRLTPHEDAKPPDERDEGRPH